MPIDSDLIRDVWSLLPWWVPWGGLLIIAAVSLLSATLGTAAILAMALPGRARVAGLPWEEHARLLTPARISLVIALLSTPLLMSLGPIVSFGPLSGVSAQHGAGLIFVLTLTATYLTAGLFASRLSGRPTSLRLWSRHCLAQSIFLFAGAIGPLVACFLVPLRIGWPLVLSLFVAWALTQLVVRNAHAILRSLGLVHPVEPALQQRVDAMFDEVGAPRATAWIVDSVSANAYALHQAGVLLFTQRLLDSLDEPQVQAIVAHEAGHFLQARSGGAKWLMTTALFGLPAGLAIAVHIGWLAGVAFAGVYPMLLILASRVALARNRELERDADSTAHAHVDPEIYIQALTAIHRANLMMTTAGSGKGSHPDLHERADAAGQESPDTPQPPPPLPTMLRAIAVLVLFAAPLYVWHQESLHATLLPQVRHEHTGHLQALALSGGKQPWVLGDLALRHRDAGDKAAYMSFSRLAVQLSLADPAAREQLEKTMGVRGSLGDP